MDKYLNFLTMIDMFLKLRLIININSISIMAVLYIYRGTTYALGQNTWGLPL